MNTVLSRLGAIARPTVRRTLAGASVVGLLAVVAATRAPGAAATPVRSRASTDAPKRAAQKAVAAENEEFSAARPVRSSRRTPSRRPPSPDLAATVFRRLVAASGSLDAASANRVIAPVTRETYNYEGEGRRDPFYSLILTDELRPLLADLRLVGILYEQSGRRTYAVMGSPDECAVPRRQRRDAGPYARRADPSARRDLHNR